MQERVQFSIKKGSKGISSMNSKGVKDGEDTKNNTIKWTSEVWPSIIWLLPQGNWIRGTFHQTINKSETPQRSSWTCSKEILSPTTRQRNGLLLLAQAILSQSGWPTWKVQQQLKRQLVIEGPLLVIDWPRNFAFSQLGWRWRVVHQPLLGRRHILLEQSAGLFCISHNSKSRQTIWNMPKTRLVVNDGLIRMPMEWSAGGWWWFRRGQARGAALLSAIKHW